MPSRPEAMVAQLTLAEKCAVVAGADFWHTPAIARVGLPALKVSDGPSGVRGAGFTDGPPSACFPCASALAATWDVALVEEVGGALAAEARSKGAHVILGPTVNIHRHPIGGRHFECYSEDPHLTARIAVAYVTGVQAGGVGCAIKHFVANDTERDRMTESSEVAERALREVYLAPFEAAVTEAGVWMVMAAYNRLHGTYCSENPRLLTEVLRDEWGFSGAVVSDWGGTHSTAAAAAAGLDLEMPGPPRHMGEHLAAAVEAGEVAEATVDRMATNVVTVLERAGALDAGPAAGAAVSDAAADETAGGEAVEAERYDDDPGRAALIRRASAAGMVLLRNEGGLLPFDPAALSSLAVIGPNAAVARIQGGGSAAVTPPYAITPLDGITDAFTGVSVVYEQGCETSRSTPLLDGRSWTNGRIDYFAGRTLSAPAVATREAGQPRFVWPAVPLPGLEAGQWSARVTATLTPVDSGLHFFKVRGFGQVRLIIDGDEVVDGWDPRRSGSATGSADLSAGTPHRLVVEYVPPERPPFIVSVEIRCDPPVAPDLMERAVAAAEGADAAVVVVGLDSEWETEGRDRASLELPGRQEELIRNVAAVNARTVVVVNAGAPVDLEWAPSVPAVLFIWYPGQEAGHALADVLLGTADPGGRLPTTFPRRLEDSPAFPYYPGENGRMEYGEGVLVGYRHYEAEGIEPRFPFGHGLSYTDFTYRDLAVADAPDGGAMVSLIVENSGKRAGSEVVQVYVADREASVLRPQKELAGFAKLHLAAGAEATVVVALTARAFSYWDEERGGWRLEPGEFDVLVGRSSADIRLRASVTR